jgi:hypothetical protein
MLLRPAVRLGMDWPRLLPGEFQAVQETEHPALTVADLKALFDQAAQVAGTPGDAAVSLGVGTAQDDGLERSLLALVQPAVPTGAVMVAQTGYTLGVVAMHPITQGLASHSGQVRCCLAWDAFQRVGERQKAGADAAIVRVASEAAQRKGAAVAADRQSCWHRDRSRSGRQTTTIRRSRIRHRLMRLVLDGPTGSLLTA